MRMFTYLVKTFHPNELCNFVWAISPFASQCHCRLTNAPTMSLSSIFYIHDRPPVTMWVAEQSAWNHRYCLLFCPTRSVLYRRVLPLPWSDPLRKKWWCHVCFFSSGNLSQHWSSALRSCHLEAGFRIAEWVWSSSSAQLQSWLLPGGPKAGAVPS